jgi:5'(3')-deoxyribonucleotidase
MKKLNTFADTIFKLENMFCRKIFSSLDERETWSEITLEIEETPGMFRSTARQFLN